MMARARGAVLAAVAVAACCAGAGAVTDVDILNFALNLECLEAEFYSYAAYGVGLSEALLGGGARPPPCRPLINVMVIIARGSRIDTEQACTAELKALLSTCDKNDTEVLPQHTRALCTPASRFDRLHPATAC